MDPNQKLIGMTFRGSPVKGGGEPVSILDAEETGKWRNAGKTMPAGADYMAFACFSARSPITGSLYICP